MVSILPKIQEEYETGMLSAMPTIKRTSGQKVLDLNSIVPSLEEDSEDMYFN